MDLFDRSSRRRSCVTWLSAGLALVAVAGCSAMPVKEGPTAALINGIEQPRDRNNMDITIHEVPVTAWAKCVEIVASADPLMAVMSVITLAPLHGCARLPRDSELKEGQRPWCIIGVPRGNAEILEHELRHCEGWDHPYLPEDPKLYARER